MSIRDSVAAALLALGFLGASSIPASAQQQTSLMIDAVAVAPPPPVLMAQQMPLPSLSRPYYRGEKRPLWIIPVHGVTAGMQALDAHSTFVGLNAGAIEANPVVASFVHHRPAFTAVKVGVAAGVIYMTDRMSKRHPIRALITATAINSAYAMIVANNYRIARDLGRRPAPP